MDTVGRVIDIALFQSRRQNFVYHAGNGAELVFAETTCRCSGAAQTNARRDERLFRIERNGVLVGCDASAFQNFFRKLARHLLGAKINQHQMAVRATRHDVEATKLEFVGQCLRISHNALLVVAEVVLQGLTEGNGLASDDMHQRTTLKAWEDRRVDLLGELSAVRQDDATTRAT